MHIRAEDFLCVIKYLLDLRSARNNAYVDDIDHLGNRRLRTLDELAVEEIRKGSAEIAAKAISTNKSRFGGASPPARTAMPITSR